MSYENLPMTRYKPLKRTPLKPAKGKVWKKLERQSKNKEKRNRSKIPSSSRKIVYERSGFRCEASNPFNIKVGNYTFFQGRCCNPAIEVHHILPKSRGGKHTPDNLLHLCLAHHAICKEYPAAARNIRILL